MKSMWTVLNDLKEFDLYYRLSGFAALCVFGSHAYYVAAKFGISFFVERHINLVWHSFEMKILMSVTLKLPRTK